MMANIERIKSFIKTLEKARDEKIGSFGLEDFIYMDHSRMTACIGGWLLLNPDFQKAGGTYVTIKDDPVLPFGTPQIKINGEDYYAFAAIREWFELKHWVMLDLCDPKFAQEFYKKPAKDVDFDDVIAALEKMTDIFTMSAEDKAEWDEWVDSKSEPVKTLCKQFPPNKLYKLTTTNRLVTIYSYCEDNTITVNVLKKYNPDIFFEKAVFGIKPEELEET